MSERITRRHFIETSSVALLFASCPALAQAAQRRSFKIEDVGHGISVFTASGGAIAFLVDDKGIAVVDSQFERQAKICLNELGKRSKAPIEFLINTHHHGDHTGGNGAFRSAVKKIVGHENVPKLQKQQAKERKLPEPTVPDTLFAKEWRGKVGKRSIRAKYYGAAHTNGDSVITFEDANTAHMGDLVFHEMHPFIDPPAGASMVNWPKVLDAAIKDHDAKTKYIFGHGRNNVVVGAKKDVERFRDYLLKVVSTVRDDMKAGKSKEEIVGREKLVGFDDFQSRSARMSLGKSLTVTFEELSKGEKK